MDSFKVKAKDGTPIAVAEYGKGNPIDLLYVHGLGEHKGRHDWVLNQLATAGFHCFAFDLRGHGESGGQRGHINDWDDYHQDLEAVATLLTSKFHLFGHSMGGLVAADWAFQSKRVMKLCLSSPLLGVAVNAPAWKLFAGRALSKIWPNLNMDNELPASDICTAPLVVEDYINDPLVFSTITPRWFTEMSSAMERVNTRANSYDKQLYLNIAGEDRAVSSSKAKLFYEAYGGEKEIREWPGLFHETLNEDCRDRVLAPIIKWLSNSASTG